MMRDIPNFERQYDKDKERVIDSYQVVPHKRYRELNHIISSDVEEQIGLLLKFDRIKQDKLKDRGIVSLFSDSESSITDLLDGHIKEAKTLLTLFAAGMFEGVSSICTDVNSKALLKTVTKTFLRQCRIKLDTERFDYVSVLMTADRSIEINTMYLPTFNFSAEELLRDLNLYADATFPLRQWPGYENTGFYIGIEDYYYLIGVMAGSLFAQELPEIFRSKVEAQSGYQIFVHNNNSGKTPNRYLWHSDYRLFFPEIFNPPLEGLTQEEYEARVDYIVKVNCYSDPRMFVALCKVNASANALGYNNIFAKDLFTAASIKRDRQREKKH